MRCIFFRLPFLILVLCLLSLAVQLPAEREEGTLRGGETMVSQFAPKSLAQLMRPELPFWVKIDNVTIPFKEKSPGLLEGTAGNLVASTEYSYDKNLAALSWVIRLHNKGQKPLGGVSVKPLFLKFAVDPSKQLPRVRHMTGSYHYDACYPPRAFRLQEEAFMTHDHAKPVQLSARRNSSYDHLPIMQFAIDHDKGMAGFFVGFEWSGPWDLEAGWERANSFEGEPLCDFVVQGEMAFGELRLVPGETVEIPKVHMGFFEGSNWDVLDNAQRRYIHEKLSGRAHEKVPLPSVTYDHWFGIHSNFDVEDMKRQASRAAELGCEYFCLDAGWYGIGAFGASGKGRWDEPDPVKFPKGVESMKELSDHVRKLGMGFGVWHQIETANGAPEEAAREHPGLFQGYRMKLDTEEGQTLALQTLRKWIKTYHLTWMRWEFAGTFPSLAYVKGLYKVMDTLQEEFPDLRIEGCSGGGQFFDFGMSRRTQSVWLSDHTANPEVCRFMQTAALRFWPPHFLNMAVRVHRNTGDREAFAHNILSRMVGALSFSGDIAQWSPEATVRVRKLVDIYKEIRSLFLQPAYFPLDQPHSTRDWDVVVFGDGSGQGQLLYAFRIDGPENVFIKVPGKKKNWKRLIGAENARIEPKDEGFILYLEEHSSVLWKR